MTGTREPDTRTGLPPGSSQVEAASSAGHGRPTPSLGELRRAWAAVQAGRFRALADETGADAHSRPDRSSPASGGRVALAADTSDGSAGGVDAAVLTSGPGGGTTRTQARTAPPVRVPGLSARPGEWWPCETVVPVVGAGGGVGATTLALALATATEASCRVVECCSASASGLVSASTVELGTHTGWRRGLRDPSDPRDLGDPRHRRVVLLERTATLVTTPFDVPVPLDPGREGRGAAWAGPVAVTFLDCGWDLEQLSRDGWPGRLVGTAPVVVVAAVATVPGLRRLEATLCTLDTLRTSPDTGRSGPGHAAGEPSPTGVVVGVLGALGSRRKRWGGLVAASMGPATRLLDQAGGLVEMPADRHLGAHGLTPAPLPAPLLDAAHHILDRLAAPATGADVPQVRPRRRGRSSHPGPTRGSAAVGHEPATDPSPEPSSRVVSGLPTSLPGANVAGPVAGPAAGTTTGTTTGAPARRPDRGPRHRAGPGTASRAATDASADPLAAEVGKAGEPVRPRAAARATQSRPDGRRQ